MKSVLKELDHVEKYKSYQVLNQVVDYAADVQIKIPNESKIVNTKLKKIGARKHFYIVSVSDLLKSKPEVTIKIIISDKLFFLKTSIKEVEGNYYFENYEHLYELIRRKRQRFLIPKKWPQTAVIQSAEAVSKLRSDATIIEMSKAGMKLNIKAEIPRYEKNQIINLRFKIYRRAEIQLSAKIIHLKKNSSAGPTIGVQFMEHSILSKNKIQNICDDLAFFHAAEPDV